MIDTIFDGPTTFAPRPGDPLPQYRSLVTAEMIGDVRRALGIEDHGRRSDSPADVRGASAHRMLVLGLVTRALNNWCNGRFDQEGRIEVTYRASVGPGDVLTFDGRVESIEEHEGAACAHAWFRASVGDREIVSGWAHQPFHASGS